MENYSIFDIIGPIMIGPSSSHTAGAARIGYIAMKIFVKPIKSVTFELHGSFGKTYLGHGTDKALLGGILGFGPDNVLIKDAFEIANSKGIDYHYIPTDLGNYHPNTVRINMTSKDGDTMKVIGYSIGGGKIKIIKINETDVEFNGEYTTLITEHIDVPGIISTVSRILSEHKVNIAFMRVYRSSKGEIARLIIETDDAINAGDIEAIKSIDAMIKVNIINKIEW